MIDENENENQPHLRRHGPSDRENNEKEYDLS